MLLQGKSHKDDRGILTFNNEFDASGITRIYTIENHSPTFIRGWQGHKIEQRWFACMNGSFEILVIKVDDFMKPSRDLTIQKYCLTDEVLTYLHIPAGCITAIKSEYLGSKLLILTDHRLGEVNDEYRYDLNYFNEINCKIKS
ncbi:WxcM-like domain-containing protein [Pedobacter sp. Leaf250]|uniref:WxcM-like domain-containing protein n=1 Tax=Pedobacter sp. Leaf250 TaxID=2876559 RepID=UPI001E402428|nr:WxcM-like domain-containing protein [Pedobacter sp. Leaf250]